MCMRLFAPLIDSIIYLLTIFIALALTEREVESFYKIYKKIDIDGSGSIEIKGEAAMIIFHPLVAIISPFYVF